MVLVAQPMLFAPMSAFSSVHSWQRLVSKLQAGLPETSVHCVVLPGLHSWQLPFGKQAGRPDAVHWLSSVQGLQAPLEHTGALGYAASQSAKSMQPRQPAAPQIGVLALIA